MRNGQQEGNFDDVRRNSPAMASESMDASTSIVATPAPRRVEHPFGTIKARLGATHFLIKRLPNVGTETALHVLAYNLTRVMNVLGRQELIAAIKAA